MERFANRTREILIGAKRWQALINALDIKAMAKVPAMKIEEWTAGDHNDVRAWARVDEDWEDAERLPQVLADYVDAVHAASPVHAIDCDLDEDCSCGAS